MENSNSKSIATFTHLSVLTQYFIPFGNFIFPLVIWSSAKKDSEFVDQHGKHVLNFQLSLFLYTLILGLIAIPILVFTIFRNVAIFELVEGNFTMHDFSAGNISGIVVVALTAVLMFFVLKTFEFFLVIFGSVKAANGDQYKYPFTISFIK